MTNPNDCCSCSGNALVLPRLIAAITLVCASALGAQERPPLAAEVRPVSPAAVSSTAVNGAYTLEDLLALARRDNFALQSAMRAECSAAGERQFNGTKIAPSFAHANMISKNSTRLRQTIATRSSRVTPSDTRTAAARAQRSSSCA